MAILLSAAVLAVWGTEARAQSVLRPVSVPEGSQLLSHVGTSPTDTTSDFASLPGSGHIVKYQRPEDADALVAIQVFARRTGTIRAPRDRFRVLVLDEANQVIHEEGVPFAAIQMTPEMHWYTLNMPGVLVPTEFSVVLDFNPNESRAIDLGKRGSSGTNSFMGLPGQEPFAPASGEWMVRAWVLPSADYDPAEQSTNLSDDGVIGYVQDTSTLKRSLYRSGHVVAFRCPEDQNVINQVRLYGNRYGYDTPPDRAFTLSLLNEDRRVIKAFDFPYSTIEKSEGLSWLALDIKPTPVPDLFYVALSFDPTPTRGVLVGLDETNYNSHSYKGLPGENLDPLVVGDWMIRARMSDSVRSSKANARSAMIAVKGEKFTEPVEREFDDGPSSFDSFLDLDFDEVLAMPQSVAQAGGAAQLDWARTNGVDVRVQVLKNPNPRATPPAAARLGLIQCKVMPYQNDRWEKTSPAGIRSYKTLMTGDLGMSTLTIKPDEMPTTYLLRTREEGLGVLQVLGFSPDFRTVKIRYKMVTFPEEAEGTEEAEETAEVSTPFE